MSCLTLRQKLNLPLIYLLRQYQFPRCVSAAVHTYTLDICCSKSPQDNVLTLYCHLVKSPKTVFWTVNLLYSFGSLNLICSLNLFSQQPYCYAAWTAVGEIKAKLRRASSQTWNDFKIVFTIPWLGKLTMPPMWLWHSAPSWPDTRLRSFWLPAQHPLA